MRLNTITTLRGEDFPSERSWIDKLLFPINQFLTSATQAINGNITFGDNIPGVTQLIKFTYSGTSDLPKTFKWGLTTAPVEVRLCSAYENDVGIPAIFAWSYANGQVSIGEIYSVAGGEIASLTVGAVYKFTFRGQT